ncbi:MFS general substrate transporter [Exidia glandulosa HHB12029]|uniref:MFS general substrate transporter n=1 Tax=Exidia glandulosa HHB12029 TaxID=1314781 RepID=A0A165MRD6_EXIGL|nr:MFS general substrate transporter [Exidia glandulosa HHB12029]
MTGTASQLEPLLPAKRRETPLPALQLAILCMVRLSEPVAYTQIFPYVNRMMELLHVTDDPAQIGFYSGLVDSVFALAQLTMIFQWGRLSDRIGRKPCILIGITGAACSTLLFGFSSSLYTALLARTMAGLLSGNIAVIQSMVGEMTDETNQARAYPIVELIWYMGSIVGTLLGGTLSEPAEHFPEVFGDIQLLKDYPFLLPCAIAFSMAMFGVLIGFFFLEETLPAKRKANGLPPFGGYDAIPTTEEPSKDQVEGNRPSVWSLITDPVIISVLRPYFLLSLQVTGLEVVFTLFSYTAIHLGGLSRNPAEIGIALAAGGLFAAVTHPFLFPALSKRFELKSLYCAMILTLPLSYMSLPILNIVARRMTDPENEDMLTPHGRIVIWILIGMMLVIMRLGGMAYAANTIFVKHAAPSKEALGSTFGVVQTVGSVSRGLAPALVSSLFAITASHNLMGGWFVWLFMAGVGVVSIFAVLHVRDGAYERERGIPRR